MKKPVLLTGLITLIVALSMVGCEDDEVPFVGKWEIQFIHNISFVNDTIYNDTTFYFDPGDAWIEYKADKTGHTYIKDQEDYDFTWSESEGIINFRAKSNNSSIYLDYVVNGNTFVWHNIMPAVLNYPRQGDTFRIEYYVWAIRE